MVKLPGGVAGQKKQVRTTVKLPGEVAGPGEADEDDCDDVMSQHLVEVLAPGLQEMRHLHG